MTRRRYRLERGQPKRLVLQWRRGFRDLSVMLDGATVPVDTSTPERIVRVPLPDGSTLWMQRVPRTWWSIEIRDRLRLERRGAPVPGSDFDPLAIGRRAASLMALFGFLSFAFAALWIALGGGRANPLEGLLLMLLAVFAAFGRRFPVIAAAVVIALTTVLPMLNGVFTSPAGLIIRTAVVVHLFRQWQLMRPAPGASRVLFE